MGKLKKKLAKKSLNIRVDNNITQQDLEKIEIAK